ncbi:glutamine-hydrolyzing GMP synthase [Candidatus Desantisbacteria bacterium CG_4_10_14_0_8_um_filter_48_22]|uniref:GMP synthase [glutamine-hydrolyzing] n=1 Tax=Candidatus Desantisbacteria bacterium CG_4_10_14_0_8_um_filter_48_22 TaxID=1974543 RepID=A0A2M7S595_9BACT|nr:MAG: glutamine-hydrolyzing GMP synthase [Candidatus Desantisbacteria bacterium CG1_02_49_89]PIV54186.1 MAG: glutamine-hydrolyzing GMP synthase [Candidatus Desantisbacteria bacterium CG02_land_8_20_14_3_00_49_13]PIZ14725.1 MAG: glutamine-hydrolyzing GMP synthase [Candidatus Desantisbacteria bacterium CG_4_10_14_0_8_um_filter_48_22]PJB28644.1 MAG: glutamine-hydrolyzing GMP synthase [Candidatus Desantisbacteria bacterium CG_4_9_14_3_um_filter_50_7]
MQETILILNFGSQYDQLIARRVRENNVFCRVVPYNINPRKIREISPKGIIFTGSPASTYKSNIKPKSEIFDLGIPILGICYGMQVIAHMLKGKVSKAKKREYGNTPVSILRNEKLFAGIPKKFICWMSHGDYVAKMPCGFERIASTGNTDIAAMADKKRNIWAVQFHPEVIHTRHGKQLFRNFLYKICGCSGDWTMGSLIKESIADIRASAKGGRVLLGLSGGVDSSVCAVLIHKAIGKKLTCIFVDNGLLRKNEGKRVQDVFRRNFRLNLRYVNASRRFLKKLKGVLDPERKRKIIGIEFIRVFEAEAKKLGKAEYLAQGTLYPDVIESRSALGGPSARIKTHHNVGGLPEKMKLKLIEPLKYLFKDEVRKLGLELGMPEEIIWRQPFPGPGLAVRVIGEVTKERLDILREVDRLVVIAMKKAGLYRKLWQSFAVLLPVKSVGVMGDERTYENAAALRMVTSEDAMTADWARVPYTILAELSNQIINEVKGVNRVVYDISSKPPSTIEWE